MHKWWQSSVPGISQAIISGDEEPTSTIEYLSFLGVEILYSIIVAESPLERRRSLRYGEPCLWVDYILNLAELNG